METPFPAISSSLDTGRMLGRRIRTLRESRDWTLDSLADRIGVTAVSLREFEETGQAPLDLVLRVAFTLDRPGAFDGIPDLPWLPGRRREPLPRPEPPVRAPSNEREVRAALARGEIEFLGVPLLVQRGVLVPRAETEILGHEAVRRLRELGDAGRVVDVCCGCGNLACTLAAKVPGTRVWATDLDPECTALASRNAGRLGLPVRVCQGDLFAPLAEEKISGSIDLIVCNPPYISTGKLENARAHLLDAEPRLAFDGGPFGLAIQVRVIREALPLLKSGGLLAFEFGAGQERQMRLLFLRSRAYEEPEFVADASGVPRVVVARKL